MRTILLTSSALLAVVLFAAGCLEGREACAQEEPNLVTGIPWPDMEQADYVLLDADTDEQCGTGTLAVERQGDQYALSLSFENNGDSDETTVIVDAETLKPASVRRERTIEDETEVVEGEYDEVERVIRVVELTDGEERTIPRRLDVDNYHDNESSLFLWRTIDFTEGYEASYDAVLVNQGGTHRQVTIRVVEKEEVTVPAGTFQAWRVEISTEDVDQVAWFTDTPEHALLQYDNSVQRFQLTSIE